MIYSLTGEILFVEPNTAVIECGGVGFKCVVSNSTLQRLPPVGSSTTLFTHLNVSQDAMTLFGFATKSELSCFRMLTGVSGIGPKTAIAVLSAMTPEQLAMNVASGDYKAITCAQGIGPKQAQRIVLELKDKVTSMGAPADGVPADAAAVSPAVSVPAGNSAEAIRALMVLGCTSGEASQLVAQLDQSQPVEQLIQQALRLMASK